MYDIKDALKSGASKEQLLKDYEAALIEAQAELAAELAAREVAMAGLDEARLEAICGVLGYVAALGICKEEDFTDDLINHIVDILKKEEEDIVRKVKFMAMLTSMPGVKMVQEPVIHTIKDADALEAFLKGKGL